MIKHYKFLYLYDNDQIISLSNDGIKLASFILVQMHFAIRAQKNNEYNFWNHFSKLLNSHQLDLESFRHPILDGINCKCASLVDKINSLSKGK